MSESQDSPERARAQATAARVMIDDAAPALLAAHAALTSRTPAALPAVARQPAARVAAALAMHIRDLAELRQRLR
jgi:hypothetical protein